MSKHPSAKPRLTLETIAAAALAITDSEGFEAVSMRRVAETLNVGTMSLYYYVKTKDDLVAAMDDVLMGEILLPTLPTNWRRAMMEIAKRTYEMYARHPWSIAAMISASPGVNAMRHMEQCLQALSRTPMTARQKITLLTVVDDFVFGYALRANAGNIAVNRKFVDTQIATGAFPRVKEVLIDGRAKPDQDRFEKAVNALLDTANAT